MNYLCQMEGMKVSMSSKTKYIIAVCFWSLSILFLSITTLIEWIQESSIRGWTIFIIAMGLYFLLNLLTYGVREEKQVDDELDTHIKAKSARIIYPFLMIISVIIYYFFSDYNNYPLLVLIVFIFIARPLFEFIYSRKFK